MIAAVFACAVAVAVVVPGARLRVGPVRISLGDVSRVAFQASLVALVAMAGWSFERRTRLATTLAVGLVVAAAVGDSFPRRVGDGAEYMAMALSLGRGGGPALSPEERRSIGERLAATPGFAASSLESGLTGADGRQDFPHFWLYPLAAAPFVALADVLGVHPNHAFTIVNVVLVVAVVWMLAGRGDHLLAMLFAAGPLTWWIDKAHAEVFMAVLIATSVYCLEWRPRVAMLAAGLATAQNPAAGGLLALQAIGLVRAGPRRPTSHYLTFAAALAVAALNPAYYLMRLGKVSPLAESSSIGMPGLRAFLAPVTDPNLGLVFYAPVFVAAAALGLKHAPRRTAIGVASLCVLLLAAFTQTHNVNHGGTAGMSRYALWLMAALVPLAGYALRSVDGRRPAIASLAIAVTVVTTWMTFRPALDERARDGPSVVAATLWAHWPALDAPLPEVFAERSSGTDGWPPVPVSNPACTKILVRGDGMDAWFPFPCEPLAAPPQCVGAGVLCYVDQGRFAPVPAQRGFSWTPQPERSWTVRSKNRLADVRKMLGDHAAVVRLGDAQRVVTGSGVSHLWVVEGSQGAAVWAYPLAGERAQLVLRLARPAELVVHGSDGHDLQPRVRLTSGDHVVPLDTSGDALVIVADAPSLP